MSDSLLDDLARLEESAKPKPLVLATKAKPAWIAKRLPPLIEWIPTVSPGLQGETRIPFHLGDVGELFGEALDILEGRATGPLRVLCTYPIRHWKTETFCHGVIWLLEHIPTLRIILMTYSDERAKHVGKRLREIAEHTTVGPTRGFNEIKNWQNAQGGGVVVMSADQSKEGHDCHVLLADDPIDEFGAAVGEQRETVDRAINYYTARCMRRGVPGPVMIIMSRQHPDDPIGRRLARTAVKWRHLHHPAIVDEGGPNERAFAPDVWSLEQLKAIRAEQKETDPYERVWYSRFQGEPVAPGASFYNDLPARYSELPTWPGYRDAIGIDMSYSTKRAADWFAGVLVRVWTRQIYVRAVLRVKPDPREVPNLIRGLKAEAGGDTAIPVFTYIAGPELGVVARLNVDHNLSIQPMQARVNKLWRTQRTIGSWNGGTILVPNELWAPGYIKRIKQFTGFEGDEDDDSDALASVHDAMVGFAGVGPTSGGRRRY